MKRVGGACPPAEQRRLVLEGEAALQLAELLLAGWVVVRQDPEGWLLERLRKGGRESLPIPGVA